MSEGEYEERGRLATSTPFCKNFHYFWKKNAFCALKNIFNLQQEKDRCHNKKLECSHWRTTSMAKDIAKLYKVLRNWNFVLCHCLWTYQDKEDAFWWWCCYLYRGNYEPQKSLRL